MFLDARATRVYARPASRYWLTTRKEAKMITTTAFTFASAASPKPVRLAAMCLTGMRAA